LALGVPAEELASFRFIHACLAQGFFAVTWAALVMTSPKWEQGPSIVQDSGVPSLRSLASFGAIVTGIQVILGAAFRHGLTSVVPHIVGAIGTTVVLLVVGTFTITQFPKHRPLVGSAWHLIGMVSVQIGLGVLAFVGRLNHPEGAVPTSGLIASTVAHVVFGALTLAASIALALQVRYHVRPRAAFESGLPVAS
jgi:heme A synthase